MKKFCSLLCVIIIVLFSAVSCSNSSSNPDIESSLSSFSQQLEQLKQSQESINQSNTQKFQELDQKLDSSINKVQSENNIESQKPADPVIGFSYTLSADGEACITGYVGKEDNLVIPASIDGYRVTSIGDRAFEGYSLKSVIISEGIKSIGWFSFYGSITLSSITVPSSVTSIGYSALGEPSSRLTVYCHSNSFAKTYAQSFGLTYVVI